jgi:rubrerythrin
MAIPFDAESIFEIGVQIEKNGKTFYTAVSKRVSDEALKSLFTELAEWEDQHIQLFQQLQAELPENVKEQNFFDPNDEMGEYLKAAADTHVFVASTDISQLAAKCASPVEALDMALTFEKDSVVYYTTMKKVVAKHFGREQIDLLIDEELEHISILNTKKKQIGS